MTIDFSNALTPSSFVDYNNEISNIHFQIPLYQRPYAWSKTEIEQLLNDLWEVYKKFTSDQNYNDYYIGILSIAPIDYDNNLFDLIDGQQRITTILLLSKVFQECNELAEMWSVFEKGRLHLIGREQDQRYLNDENKTPENQAFKIAIDTIKNFLYDEKRKNSIVGFGKYVYNHLAFFIAPMPKGYGPLEKNRHFVRMNNRGRQLEKHEILKVKLIGKIEDDLLRQKYLKIWNKISQLGEGDNEESYDNQKSDITLKNLLNTAKLQDEYSTKTEIEREKLYSPILNFEDFLLIGLSRYPQKADNKKTFSFDRTKLLMTFQNELERWDTNIVIDFINFLNHQYELLIKYFIRRDQQDSYSFHPQAIDASNSFMSTDEQRLHLKVLQSFLYVTRQPHEWLIKAFDWLDNTDQTQRTIEKFINMLIDIDSKQYNEMKNDLNNEEKLKCGTSTPHYWFYRLDYEIWVKRNDIFKDNPEALKIANKFTFHRHNSVEHIQAQTNPDNGENQTDDHFSNLALVSISQNSKLSNNFFTVKQEIITKWIKEGKTIPSLKLLHVLYLSNTWDNDSKKKHFDMIKKNFNIT